MKQYLSILTLILLHLPEAKSQNPYQIGLESNFDIYRYTAEGRNSNQKARSYTCGLYGQRAVKVNKTSIWSTGLAVKSILYRVEKLRTIDDDDGSYLIDLHSFSLSLGFRSGYEHLHFVNEEKTGFWGVRSTIYFLEFYSCKLYDQKGTFHGGNGLSKTRDLEFVGNFPLASANLMVFYRLLVRLDEKFPIGFTASLGTNLYSDWDQFSRYAWIGLGVDMGFGKKVATKEPKQP